MSGRMAAGMCDTDDGVLCRSVGLCVPPAGQIDIRRLRAGEVERDTELLRDSVALLDRLLCLRPRRHLPVEQPDVATTSQRRQRHFIESVVVPAGSANDCD